MCRARRHSSQRNSAEWRASVHLSDHHEMLCPAWCICAPISVWLQVQELPCLMHKASLMTVYVSCAKRRGRHTHLEADVIHYDAAIDSYCLQIALGEVVCEAANLLRFHTRPVLQGRQPAAALAGKSVAF